MSGQRLLFALLATALVPSALSAGRWPLVDYEPCRQFQLPSADNFILSGASYDEDSDVLWSISHGRLREIRYSTGELLAEFDVGMPSRGKRGKFNIRVYCTFNRLGDSTVPPSAALFQYAELQRQHLACFR
jgi:hypothetical protein